MTLRLQITIALGMLAAVAAVSAALFSYTSVDQRLHAETDTFLDDRISLVLSFVATRSQLADAGSELPFEPDIANPSPAGSLTRYDVELQFLRADGSIAAQFDQQVTDRLAQTLVTGLDAILIAFAAWWSIDQRNVDRSARLGHRFAASFAQEHRPTGIRRHATGDIESRQSAQAAWHHQCLIAGLPEQQPKRLLTRANGGQ